jgi:hypothetical protein
MTASILYKHLYYFLYFFQIYFIRTKILKKKMFHSLNYVIFI